MAKGKRASARTVKKSKRARNYPGKSAALNVRVAAATRDLLEAAAGASDRSLSAECEYQLRRALVDMGAGQPTHALMTVLGQSIDNLVRMRVVGPGWKEDDTVVAGRWIQIKKAHWLNDPYLYDMARQAMLAMLEMFKPVGEPPQDLKELINSGGQRQGAFSIESVLREIQTVDETIPFAKQTPRQRWLTVLKADLGALADRPKIWGRTGEQARELRALFSQDLLRELISLSRQAGKQPEGMTVEEKRNLTTEQIERLHTLRRKIAEIREEILT
jgi:hypothetical protein